MCLHKFSLSCGSAYLTPISLLIIHLFLQNVISFKTVFMDLMNKKEETKKSTSSPSLYSTKRIQNMIKLYQTGFSLVHNTFTERTMAYEDIFKTENYCCHFISVKSSFCWPLERARRCIGTENWEARKETAETMALRTLEVLEPTADPRLSLEKLPSTVWRPFSQTP